MELSKSPFALALRRASKQLVVLDRIHACKVALWLRLVANVRDMTLVQSADLTVTEVARIIERKL